MTDWHEAARIWRMCQSCARAFPPARAAGLLMGTAAQESLFVQRRQLDFERRTDGAYGLWQLEAGSVQDSLERLDSRRALDLRAKCWLRSQEPRDGTPSVLIPILAHDSRCDVPRIERVLRSMTDPRNDALSCLFARLHYLRRPEPIPEGAAAQAAYWKRWYNTPLGSGTVGEYLDKWPRLCLPAMTAGAGDMR